MEENDNVVRLMPREKKEKNTFRPGKNPNNEGEKYRYPEYDFTDQSGKLYKFISATTDCGYSMGYVTDVDAGKSLPAELRAFLAAVGIGGEKLTKEDIVYQVHICSKKWFYKFVPDEILLNVGMRFLMRKLKKHANKKNGKKEVLSSFLKKHERAK